MGANTGTVTKIDPKQRAVQATIELGVDRAPNDLAVVLLEAIARSDGTRASVSAELLRTNLSNGILGPISFTSTGDVLGGKITIDRIVRGRVTVVDVIVPPAPSGNG